MERLLARLAPRRDRREPAVAVAAVVRAGDERRVDCELVVDPLVGTDLAVRGVVRVERRLDEGVEGAEARGARPAQHAKVEADAVLAFVPFVGARRVYGPRGGSLG